MIGPLRSEGGGQGALDVLLRGLGAEADFPGVGAGAGLVVALAAGLTEGGARQSPDWEDAGGVTAQAAALRRRALRLAARNAEAHAAAREALGETSRGQSERERPHADIRLGSALHQAAELPLEIAAAGMDAAELAALLAEEGAGEVRPDAVGAALLAGAGAAAAACLVEVNLATQPGDERVSRAREFGSLARAAGDRALAAGGCGSA